MSKSVGARLGVSQGLFEVVLKAINNSLGTYVMARMLNGPHVAWPGSFYRIFYVFMSRSLVIFPLTAYKYSFLGFISDHIPQPFVVYH